MGKKAWPCLNFTDFVKAKITEIMQRGVKCGSNLGRRSAESFERNAQNPTTFYVPVNPEVY